MPLRLRCSCYKAIRIIRAGGRESVANVQNYRNPTPINYFSIIQPRNNISILFYTTRAFESLSKKKNWDIRVTLVGFMWIWSRHGVKHYVLRGVNHGSWSWDTTFLMRNPDICHQWIESESEKYNHRRIHLSLCNKAVKILQYFVSWCMRDIHQFWWLKTVFLYRLVQNDEGRVTFVDKR